MVDGAGENLQRQRRLAVGAELAPYVEAIFAEDAPRDDLAAMPYAVLPGPNPVLGLQTRGRLAVLRGQGPRWLARAGVTGLQTEPRWFRGTPDARTVLIVFKPHGLFSLLGQPVGSLTDEHPGLETLLGSAVIAQVEEQLAAATTDQQRTAALHAFLLRLLRSSTRRPARSVTWAVQQILAQRGNVRIERLSAGAGLSVRQLERQFKEQVGVGPKRLASLARFRASVMALPRRESWTDLALDLGYFDQAHFVADFTRYAGTSPAAYVREQAVSRRSREGGTLPAPRGLTGPAA